MSYTEQLQRLAAIERHLVRVCRDAEVMDGEVFDKTLEPLLTQLYRAHRGLCRRASRRAGTPAPGSA
jgi:hypothetical protein